MGELVPSSGAVSDKVLESQCRARTVEGYLFVRRFPAWSALDFGKFLALSCAHVTTSSPSYLRIAALAFSFCRKK